MGSSQRQGAATADPGGSPNRCGGGPSQQDGGTGTARSMDKMGKCSAVKDHMVQHLVSGIPLHKVLGSSCI